LLFFDYERIISSMNEAYEASDLLKRPIPIEARLTFSEPDKDHVAWRHATTIAERLDTYDRKVTRFAAYLGLPYDERFEPTSGKTVRFYPPYVETLLKEELEWKETYDQLPVHVGITTIVENIGRSHGWTNKTLEELGIQPVKGGQYHRSAVRKLRHISMSVPLDDGWYNLHQLELFTGADREWIQRRLSELRNEPQRRRSSLTGKIHTYYDPSSVIVVMEALRRRPEAAGDWLTVHAIAKRVGRTEKWVVARLEPYQDLGLLKQDDTGVSRRHWSPAVAEMLAEESGRLMSLPDGKDFLNIHRFARRLGHATNWAIQVVGEIGIEPEEYRDGKGRSGFGFRESLLPQIKAFAENHVEKDQISDEILLESLFAVGSLRSKVKALRKKITTLKHEGLTDEDIVVKEFLHEIADLNAELRVVQRRHYRLVGKMDHLSGSTSGDSKKQHLE
jgi:DNA-binding Lrp family transcriptional regulator